MALPPSNEKQVRLGKARAVTPARRGTESKGVPSTQPSEWRSVTYRIEDELRERRGPYSSDRGLPKWITKLYPNTMAAPEKLVLDAGSVAYRAEPDWRGPPEAPLSPPPLVQAPPPRPPKKKKHIPEDTKPPLPEPVQSQPVPSGPLVCQPGYRLTKSGKACEPTPELLAKWAKEGEKLEDRQRVRDYVDATLGDGFENAAKVAKWASHIPGPAGGAFKLASEIFEFAHDAYETAKLVEQLIIEMKQPDAVAEGSKELVKRGEDAFTKAAEKKLDKILKKKGIYVPDPVKKEIIKRARKYFDEKVRDPALEKGKEELEKRWNPKERDRSFLERWIRGLSDNGTDPPIVR